MALDLVVERRGQKPIASVSVEVAVYGALIALVLTRQPRAFLRLKDSYADAEIPLDELGDFGQEADEVARLPDVSAAVKGVARRIYALAEIARRVEVYLAQLAQRVTQ
jgi:hypothetical protein